jgi:alkanesulfonate monooxygenase SsuD/methylene tetrahydromethanopterin reductase-like flavin-dependent oxidoreductase (luciferase family)
MTVRVGVMLPTFRDDPADALAVAIEAERLGIDGVFVYDHLWPMGHPERPALAPFPLLGAVAQATASVRLGTLVARVGVVPDEVLVAEFVSLEDLAPGRVVAALGTGDRLSFGENQAYGVPPAPAEERRAALGRCAQALVSIGLVVWVGGRSRRTVAVAEAAGAAVNFWNAGPPELADQASRSEVTWGGMVPPEAGRGAVGIISFARPLAQAGPSWLVFGWPLDLHELAAAAEQLRSN